MSSENSELCLKSELSRFETQLETPVVPGELPVWLQAVEQALSTLIPDLRTCIDNRHRATIEEIAKQDQELLTRVEQLKSEDRAILQEAERQVALVSSLAEQGDKLEPDEGHVAQAVRKIVDEGLQLVIRIRKQEAAISTWFMEAFDRDSGVAD